MLRFDHILARFVDNSAAFGLGDNNRGVSVLIELSGIRELRLYDVLAGGIDVTPHFSLKVINQC